MILNIQIKSLESGFARVSENVRTGINTKCRFYSGKEKLGVWISSGYRNDEKLPFELGLNEYDFQDVEILILAEESKDKRGLIECTIEIRKRKKVLTNSEKPTLLEVKPTDELKAHSDERKTNKNSRK